MKEGEGFNRNPSVSHPWVSLSRMIKEKILGKKINFPGKGSSQTPEKWLGVGLGNFPAFFLHFPCPALHPPAFPHVHRPEEASSGSYAVILDPRLAEQEKKKTNEHKKHTKYTSNAEIWTWE